ncbi:MAG: SAM-dependent methyltransferase [Anaerolineaceae bacterium 4572_78]|nr:MAG: SAM-dependent methyltransferase [Anaerolineaceae bacterium 4572_78]
MNILKHNRTAWNKQVENGNKWTIPVITVDIEAARQGDWKIVLTPTKPVPKEWYPELKGANVLCLASGGGQQGPILAAVGANVTVFDNSPKQLERDRMVAERDSLNINTIQGDMADLSVFPDESFDLIIHPVSNVFAPDIRPVWKEAFRVLRHGGVLVSGFMNPAIYLFDWELADRTGELHVKYSLPYADIEHLHEEHVKKYLEENEPLEFSHTLDDQIGGQIEAGFIITGFYEDNYTKEDGDAISKYMSISIATRALKP